MRPESRPELGAPTMRTSDSISRERDGSSEYELEITAGARRAGAAAGLERSGKIVVVRQSDSGLDTPRIAATEAAFRHVRIFAARLTFGEGIETLEAPAVSQRAGKCGRIRPKEVSATHQITTCE